MGKIGFIGYGSMGRMLVKGFIDKGCIHQEQIIITRKDKSKLQEIKSEWPQIQTVDTAVEVVKNAKVIFICIKPLEFKAVLEKIKPFIDAETHIISIAGSVDIGNIEGIADCKVSKVIPTITSEVYEGISLVCHNAGVSTHDAEFIENLFEKISKVKKFDEKDLGFATEITSCGPGIIAALFEEFTNSAAGHSDCISKTDIQEMLVETVLGTAKLILEKNMSFDEVVSRVATKGGITEEGVKILGKGLLPVFDDMFDTMVRKRKQVEEKVNGQFVQTL